MNDAKIKGLKPTQRVKKRFLLIKIHASKKYNFKELSFSINDHLLKVLGAQFYGEQALWIIRERFDEKLQQVVLKVKVTGVDKVSAALALGLKINNENIRIEIKKVSATLKQLFKENE